MGAAANNRGEIPEDAIDGVVAVTGCSSGIGRAIAATLTSNGLSCVGLDLMAPDSDGALRSFYRVDVTDEVAVNQVVEQIESNDGPIAGLVNAAGILGKVHEPDRIRLSDWERELRVDLTGTFIVARAVGVLMAARNKGSIVNIASIAGMTSAPTYAYSAAKAGVISLTATLARAWGRRGVRVNAVSPGFTLTETLEKGIAAGVLTLDRMAGATALGRLVDVSEVANAVAWLLSSKSTGVTGINLPVDAGFLAGSTWSAYG